MWRAWSTLMARSLPLLLSLLALALPATSAAETLLIQRVKAEAGMTLPARGQSAAEVERHFGAPAAKLAPVGGQKKQWPVIERWSYPAFTVYLQHGRVLDAVANQASADETGPRPATP
jgi:hypothetical protein